MKRFFFRLCCRPHPSPAHLDPLLRSKVNSNIIPPAMHLSISLHQETKTQVLEPHGALDYNSVHILTAKVEHLIQMNGRNFVVDLGDVEYVDSAGLGELLIILKKITQNEGKLILVGLNDRVRSLFNLTRMSDVFATHRTRDEAYQILSPGSFKSPLP